MGRGKELSDFQRGTVVGCHLCHKSTREISAMLSLPRSTVGDVILKWKRSRTTTTLPRSGRPHKLKERDRRLLLETVAREKRLPSVEALAAEFQSAAGASVSTKTLRKELRGMGFRGRVSSYGRSKGGQKVVKKTPALVQEDVQADVSRLDLRVGRIVAAARHPDADELYVEQVDVGEASPRTVVSDLAKHIPVEQMQNHLAVLLCNLKPVVTRGVVSKALLLCARSPSKVEILEPPSGAVPGDRVTVEHFPAEPDKELNPEQSVWEQVRLHLRTDAQCFATYKGAALEVKGKGVCKAQTMRDCEIK